MGELIGHDRSGARTNIQDIAIKVTAKRAILFDLHPDAIEKIDAFFENYRTGGLVEVERGWIDPGIECDLVTGVRCLINRDRIIISVETETLVYLAGAKRCAVLKRAVIMGD